MATGTAAVQAALNTAAAADGRASYEIIRSEPTDGTTEIFLVSAGSSTAVGTYRYCTTTTAGGAAAQAAEVIAAMKV